jgi:hypothetical protein
VLSHPSWGTQVTLKCCIHSLFWRAKSGFRKCEKNMRAKVEHALSDEWTWMQRGCQLVLLLKLYG